MSKFYDILMQLDKERFRRTTDRWTTAQGLRLKNELPDEVPYGKQVDPDINKPSVSTITTQVKKKKVSNKFKRDRIADKSVLLADRLDIQTYK
jgi:hypothetical protein